MTLLSVFISAAFMSLAFGMPMPVQIKPGLISTPLKINAVANGGRALDDFSLLSVTDAATSGGERMILGYGDRFGKVWKGEPGFFQIALDRDGRRIVIDLSQITRTGIDPTQLRALLAKSKYVASSDMTMDPQDQTTNLTLSMKVPVELHVSTSSIGPAQVILDLKSRQ